MDKPVCDKLVILSHNLHVYIYYICNVSSISVNHEQARGLRVAPTWANTYPQT